MTFQQMRWAVPILATVALGAMVTTDRLSPILAVLISVVVLASTLILSSTVLGANEEQRPIGAVVLASGHAVGLLSLLMSGFAASAALFLSLIHI